MKFLLFIFAGMAIYKIFKENLEDTKEVFLKIKTKRKTKCRVYLFPVWETKRYRSAEND